MMSPHPLSIKCQERRTASRIARSQIAVLSPQRPVCVRRYLISLFLHLPLHQMGKIHTDPIPCLLQQIPAEFRGLEVDLPPRISLLTSSTLPLNLLSLILPQHLSNSSTPGRRIPIPHRNAERSLLSQQHLLHNDNPTHRQHSRREVLLLRLEIGNHRKRPVDSAQ